MEIDEYTYNIVYDYLKKNKYITELLGILEGRGLSLEEMGEVVDQVKYNITIENIDREESVNIPLIVTANEFSDFAAETKKYYLHPWLTDGSINLIAGYRGCGKSWFVLSILGAVSKGKSFEDWECQEKTKCMYLDGELPISDLQERLKALDIANENLLIASNAHQYISGRKLFSLKDETSRKTLTNVVIANGVKLLAIDNLASLCGAMDENSKQDWTPINDWLLELRFAGVSTILLHHVNKQGGQRGTIAREDNLSTSIMLKEPDDYRTEDGCRFICHFSKNRVPYRWIKYIVDKEMALVEEMDGRYYWVRL